MSARQIAEDLDSANAFVVAAVFEMNSLLSDGEYESAVVLAEECRVRTTSCGVGYLIDACLAYALVQLGRVDDAVESLVRARQVPPSTQWDHLIIVVSALVLPATDGPEVASRGLAVAAKEAVARQPGLAAELLVGFADLALQLGEPERARRYCDLQAFGNVGMMGRVLEELGDGSPSNRDARRAVLLAENERISVLDRFANNATLAPVWLAEEIARWS